MALSGGSGDEEGSSQPAGTAQTITATNLATVNDTYAAARIRRIEAEQRWLAVQDLSALQVPEVQNNPVVQRLLGEKSAIERELTELRQRYRDDYPQVAQLRAQLSAIDQNINGIANNVKSVIRDEYRIAQRQEAGLLSELNSVSDTAIEEQGRRVQFNILNRDVQALQDQLDSLLSRYNQISSAANIESSRLSSLDSAQVPTSPYSPNLFANLLIALLIGLALGIGLTILRQIFDDRVRSPRDVGRSLACLCWAASPSPKATCSTTSPKRIRMWRRPTLRCGWHWTSPSVGRLIRSCRSPAARLRKVSRSHRSRWHPTMRVPGVGCCWSIPTCANRVSAGPCGQRRTMPTAA